MNDPYRCAWCAALYPVPSLARACEDAHLAEPAPKESK